MERAVVAWINLRWRICALKWRTAWEGGSAAAVEGLLGAIAKCLEQAEAWMHAGVSFEEVGSWPEDHRLLLEAYHWLPMRPPDIEVPDSPRASEWMFDRACVVPINSCSRLYVPTGDRPSSP